MNETNNILTKNYFSSFIFKYKNHFQDDFVDFWPQRLTMKIETG